MSLDGNPSFVCWRHRDKLTKDTFRGVFFIPCRLFCEICRFCIWLNIRILATSWWAKLPTGSVYALTDFRQYAMMLRRSGRIAFYYEESHDGMEKVYDMIYTEIPLEAITSGRYSYRSK